MTIDFLRHAEVVENRMRRSSSNAIERDMFEESVFSPVPTKNIDVSHWSLQGPHRDHSTLMDVSRDPLS